MLLRLFVYAYFPLAWVGLGLSHALGSDVWQGLVFVLAGIYVYVRIARKRLASASTVLPRPDTGLVLVYAYVIIYSALFFPRTSGGLAVLGTAPTLLVHLAFWHLLYTAPVYDRNRSAYFRDVIISFSVGFLFAFVVALATTGFSFEAGSIHDIAFQSALVRSDLDGPFLALMPIALGLAAYRRGEWPVWMTVLSGLAVLALLIYSRRGPFLAVALMLGLVLVPRRLQGTMILALILVPFLPVLWDRVAPLLVDLSQTDFVESLLARNRPQDYLTATGRLSAWVGGFEYLLDFRISHLVGYGDVPPFLLSGVQEHMHNMVLQLFFEGGLISVFLALLLIAITFRKLLDLIERDERNAVGLHALFLFFCSWLLLSAIEPMLRSFGVPHMAFLVIVISVLNRTRELDEQENVPSSALTAVEGPLADDERY